MLTRPIRLVASGDGTGDRLDLLDRLVLHHSLKVGIDSDKVIQAMLRLIFVSTSCVAIDVVCYIIARGREHAEKLAQANGGGNTVEKTKADLHTKKRSVSAKDQLIAERNEKKRALKLK